MAQAGSSRSSRKRKLGLDYINVIGVSDGELSSSDEDSDVMFIESDIKMESISVNDSSPEDSQNSTMVEVIELLNNSKDDDLDIASSSQDLFTSQTSTYSNSQQSQMSSLDTGGDIKVVTGCKTTLQSDVSQPLSLLPIHRPKILRSRLDIFRPDIKPLIHSQPLSSSSFHSDSFTSSLDTSLSDIKPLIHSQPSSSSSFYHSDSLPSSLDVSLPDIEPSIHSQGLDSGTGLVFNSNGDYNQHTNIKQKILELEEENQKLKAENEILRYNKSLSVPTDATQNFIARITFNSREDYHRYKGHLLTAFQSFSVCRVKVNDLNYTIEILKDEFDIDGWIVIDNADQVQEALKKAKHKKRKEIGDMPDHDLFVLDRTSSVSTKNYIQYESKFSVIGNKELDTDKQVVKHGACFNCDEPHTLRDCVHPKDYSKIRAAKQKFYQEHQRKPVRYHLHQDDKFSHFKPGVISANLRKALGLRDYQLPAHIYRMRMLGYPPGWKRELKVGEVSELLVFDAEGRDSNAGMTIKDVDPDKIVEYPGFNAPMGRHIRDNYLAEDCPPYSKSCNKQNMLTYFHKLTQKAREDLESSNRDLVKPSSSKTSQSDSSLHPGPSSSPTLNELENEKQKLISELIETTDASSVSDTTLMEQQSEETNEGSFKAVDITQTSDASNTHIKSTILGTPIIASIQSEETNEGSFKAVDITQTSDASNTHIKSTILGTPIIASIQSEETNEGSFKAVDITQTSDASNTHIKSTILGTPIIASIQSEETNEGSFKAVDITQTSDASNTHIKSTILGTPIIASIQSEETNEGSFKAVDITQTSDASNTHIKSTILGTPIIASISPYSRLPKQENFQKNISDVINFENLPNSTGKYKQMLGILDKVRKEMKRLSNS